MTFVLNPLCHDVSVWIWILYAPFSWSGCCHFTRLNTFYCTIIAHGESEFSCLLLFAHCVSRLQECHVFLHGSHEGNRRERASFWCSRQKAKDRQWVRRCKCSWRLVVSFVSHPRFEDLESKLKWQSATCVSPISASVPHCAAGYVENTPFVGWKALTKPWSTVTHTFSVVLLRQ